MLQCTGKPVYVFWCVRARKMKRLQNALDLQSTLCSETINGVLSLNVFFPKLLAIKLMLTNGKTAQKFLNFPCLTFFFMFLCVQVGAFSNEN